MGDCKELIDKLYTSGELDKKQWIDLLNNYTDVDRLYAAEVARKIADDIYGKDIYIRGLIEITNHCKNDCYYCGIRCSNGNADRYRLTKEQILQCCDVGWRLGFRTFVMQGGEDAYYTDDWYVDVIKSIKDKYSECAITLSIGERSKESYQRYYDAGADRYLLRHETATLEHYNKLHPENMSLDNRKECLYNLREIGYQVGCGFMVGSPYQTVENLADDMIFIHDLKPHMVGIGPFIPHKDTPFKDEKAGELHLTTFLLSLIRIMERNVLLPATTALGTIDPMGREEGIMAGANVIMPNLSPINVRDKYLLYDNKICTGDEASECRKCIEFKMKRIGYNIVETRGDYKI